MRSRPVKRHLSAAFVRSVLSYDPVTGLFHWKHRQDRSKQWNTRYAGTLAGYISSGYRLIQLEADRGGYRAARLAWLYMTGEWPADQVDHRNLQRNDDRWDNLRAADNSENNANRGAQSNNRSSGIRGVNFDKPTRKWRARTKVRGIQHHLGLFDTPEEAAEAYAEAAQRLRGAFARTC
jgi:hypothetical protein